VSQHRSTIWLLLLLLPYLGFAVVGELPHQHGAHHPLSRSLTAGCGQQMAAVDVDDCDLCPICQVQVAMAASASLAVSLFVLPMAEHPSTDLSHGTAPRILAQLSSSRAPPVSIS